MENDKIILILNSGSSSLKYEIIKMPSRVSMGKGLVERIGGEGNGVLTQKVNGEKLVVEQKIEDHKVALKMVLAAITDKEKGILRDISEINGIGHRVLHGGHKYVESVLVDDDVEKEIERCICFGPLHNPANLAGIRVAREIMPTLPQVAVFDTAFHQTMPSYAYMYAIPRKYYDEYKIRRYGFHGTSHKYVSKRAMEFVNADPNNTNMICCHLGNGASVTAIKNGKCIDTSMGLTPLEGLVMGTRSGDMDPAIMGFLMERGMSGSEVITMLNKKSGLLGVSGFSNDMRDVEKAAKEGNANAKEALDMFVYRVKKYIGAYTAALGKVDMLVFTGGIGENGWENRERICEGLENLGIKLDKEANKDKRGIEVVISKADSPVKIVVIPTNEELQIAIDVYNIAFNK